MAVKEFDTKINGAPAPYIMDSAWLAQQFP